jgi:carbon-monoxide dehydrogenase medium subunit
MKLRLVHPGHLIDLRRIAELAGIREEGGALLVGALTTHWEIETSPLARSQQPLLPQVAAGIADPQVRNRGTIGGSLCHADPGADYPAMALGLEAEMICAGPGGRRVVAAEDWFRGVMATALAEDEILIALRVPVQPRGLGAIYLKLPHPASRFAVVGVAAVIGLGRDGTCEVARVGITGVGAHAVRAKSVEAALLGRRLDEATIAAAAREAGAAVEAEGDLQTPTEQKAHLCRVFVERAIAEAARRCS